MEESTNGLKDELEEALLMGDCDLVKVLLDFKADPTHVSLDSLFGMPPEGPAAEDHCKSFESLDEYSRITNMDERDVYEKFTEDMSKWLKNDKQTSGYLVAENCIHGFAFLSHYLSDSFGYDKTHLRCRVEANRGRTVRSAEGVAVPWLLHPMWSDIFLWAVLLSQQELAKLLWARCDDPLRLALLASLLCKQLMAKCDGIEKEELGEQAAEYERWAAELLDEVEAKDTPLLLLALPVLEQHTSDRSRDSHGKDARPAGGHGGKNGAMGKNGKREFNLWPLSPIELAHNEGNLELSCKKFIAHRFSKELITSIYDGCVYQLVAEEKLEKSSVWSMTRLANLDGDVDELDPDYMNSIMGDEAGKGVSPLRDDLFEAVEMSWPVGKFYMPAKGTPLESAMHLVRTPRFKMIVHNTMGGGYLLLQMVFLCGVPFWGPHGDRSGYYHSWQWQQGLLPVAPPNDEILLWVWTLARLKQEFAQMVRQGSDQYQRRQEWYSYFDYFTDVKQWLDLLTYLAVLGIAAVRCALWWETDGDYLKMDSAYDSLQQVAACTYAAVAVVTFVRFTDVLKISEVGLLYVMLTKMFGDVAQWLMLSLFGTFGVSVALTVLMPGDMTGEDRPFMRPIWVLVGDFDLHSVDDYFPDSGTGLEVSVLTSMVLFLYVFIMTVVLVNLLIAQMSSTYEKLKDEKYEIWQAGRVTLICEYKDHFDTVPAPFNLVQMVVYSLPAAVLQMVCKSKGAKEDARSTKKEGGGKGSSGKGDEQRGPIPRPPVGLRLPMKQMAARHSYSVACEARKTYLAIEHRLDQSSLEKRVVQVKAAQQEMGAQLEAVGANVEAIRVQQKETNAKLQTLGAVDAVVKKLEEAADKLARPSPARAAPLGGAQKLAPLPQFASQKQPGDSIPGTLAADGDGDTILRGTAAFLAGLRGEGAMPDAVRVPPGRPPPLLQKPQQQPSQQPPSAVPAKKQSAKSQQQPAATSAVPRGNPTPPLAQTFDGDGNAVQSMPPGKMTVPVVLQQGYLQGDPMKVDLGDGRRIECNVPRGVKQGDTFNVVVDKPPPSQRLL